MSRRTRADPPVTIKVNLPRSIVLALDGALYDPVRGKPKYAARSTLILSLVQEWLTQRSMESSL